MKRIKILVADDDTDLLSLLQIVLHKKYDVITAQDGKKALELIKSESPDIIVLDIMMPKLNGLDLCLMLKNDEQYKDIPIIMITATTYQSGLPDGFWKIGTGSDEFITKPFDPQIVAGKIDSIVRTKILKLKKSEHHGKRHYL